MAVENLDLVAITESWVNENVFKDSLDAFEVVGYDMFNFQRKSRMGGGILLYVRKGIKCNKIDSIKDNEDIESLWLDLVLKQGKKLRVGVFYRPPNSSVALDKAICDEITKGVSNSGRSLVMGDFNLSGWGKGVGSVPAAHQNFVNCFEENFLHQLLTEPTRGDEILDFILTSDSDLVGTLRVGEALGNSDHNVIRFTLSVEYEDKCNNAAIPDFAKGDYDRFREFLRSIHWERALGSVDVNHMWKAFCEIVAAGQNKFIPIRKIRSKQTNKPPWLSFEVKKLLKAKQQAYKRLRDHETDANLSAYRIAAKKAKKGVREAKRKAEISLAENCAKNAKKFFSFYKFKTKCSSVGPLEVGDEILADDEKIVEALSKQFSSVFTRETEFDSNDVRYGTSLGNAQLEENCMEEIELSEELVRDVLREVKVNKAAGPDEIYGRVLNECADELAKPLFIIFRRSLSTSEIPDDWRHANVVPIFKKGSKSCVSNYRPVSLTSLVCKVLEKLIKSSIQMFLDRHELIHSSQHGFRSGRSCLTNLLEYLEYVSRELDEGKLLDVVYLDFSKAFDKVPHQRLLHQLWHHGIRGQVFFWIKAWLANRMQRVILNGSKSDWRSVESGVPQGSVLGPLLFIIFVNHIQLGLKCRVWKFADDIKLVGRSGDEEQENFVQGDLDALVNWANTWQMSFNYDKCKVMHLGNSNREGSAYQMDGRVLENIGDEKDLGVIISRDMKVEKQCKAARGKALKMLGCINRNVNYKSKEVVKKLYLAYVRPHLEYCVQAWRPHFQKDIESLERVQRRATKMINGFQAMEYGERLKALNLFSLKYRRLRGDMIEVFKILNEIDKVDLNGELDVRPRTRGNLYNLRKSRCMTRNRLVSFSQRVVNHWNVLPNDVVASPSLSCFKNRLDRFYETRGIVYSY